MADAEDELTELRRRAYSRSGTAEDLRRLAELETPPEAVSPVEPEWVASESVGSESVDPSALTPPEIPEDAAATPTPRRRPVLIAGAVGLLVGATIASLGILLPRATEPTVPVPGPPTALAIFDREPGERDDPAELTTALDRFLPGGLEDAELRWLGAVAESEVYVARGTSLGETYICLISVQVDQTGGACTVQPDFAVRGLTLGMGGLELRWGPLGTEIWVAERVD